MATLTSTKGKLKLTTRNEEEEKDKIVSQKGKLSLTKLTTQETKKEEAATKRVAATPTAADVRAVGQSIIDRGGIQNVMKDDETTQSTGGTLRDLLQAQQKESDARSRALAAMDEEYKAASHGMTQGFLNNLSRNTQTAVAEYQTARAELEQAKAEARLQSRAEQAKAEAESQMAMLIAADEQRKPQSMVENMRRQAQDTKDYDWSGTDAWHVAPYLLGEVLHGATGQVWNLGTGLTQSLGDLLSRGRASDELGKVQSYFDENPQAYREFKAVAIHYPEARSAVMAGIAKNAGLSTSALENYRQANLAQIERENMQNTFDVSEGVREVFGNMAYQVGQQVPAMMLTAGGGSSALVNNVARSLMGMSSYGAKLQENAEKNGYDWGNYANAAATGLVESMTEAIGSTPTLQSIAKLSLAENSVGEMMEELIGYPLEQVSDWIFLKDGARSGQKFDEIFDAGEWIKAGMSGAVLGGLLGSVGSVANIAGRTMDGKISTRQAAAELNRVTATLPDGTTIGTLDPRVATEEDLRRYSERILDSVVAQAERAYAAPKMGSELATEMGLGKNGAQTAQELRITPENVGAFTANYEAGKNGKAFEEVRTVQTGIDENMARQAFNAGQMDAIDNAVQRADNGVEQEAIANEEQRERESLRLRGSREWFDGQNPGGQPGGMVESAGRNQSGNEAAGSATGAGNQRVYRAYQKSTTGALGIAGGSTKDTVYTVGADYSKETAQAKKLASERGLRTVFFTGNNLTIKGKQVRGYVSKDRVFVRADHPKYTPEQIMRHELGHDKISLGEINVDEVLEQLAAIGMLEDAASIADAYAAAYESVGQRMTIDETFEEMVCDALADMNDLTVDERSAAAIAKVKEATEANYKSRTANAPKTTEQAARKLERKVGKELDVPAAKQKEKLRSIVETMAEQALSGDEISQDIRDELFETAYENGVKTDDEFYREAKDVKEYLRSQAIKISEYDKHDIPDWNDFRKSSWGLLRISNNGLPVDVAYQEAHEMAPYLFPKDITAASDQLMHMRDVANRIRKTDKSLDEYYGSDAEAFKESARVAFDRDVDQFLNDLRKLQRKRSDDGKASTDFAANSQINESMTMQQAKQMIQRAFVLGGIQEWYDGEYKNGDEWLRGEGVEDVAMIIDNEYSLQSAYLDKIPGILNGDFYTEDVLQAYLDGTLTGTVAKKNTAKIDLARSVAVADNRFYAPKKIENAKALYETALQRVTKANEQEVTRARAKVLLYAHNKGAAETLGLTESELNKKLRSWSNYSAKARDISQRINSGVQASNRWTGIENMAYVTRAQVSPDEVARMVKSVEGKGDAFQNNYIARTMMALDTHIDWSWLTFKFDTYAGVNEKKATKCSGYYYDRQRLIHVQMDAPNTVAHEMGHALDYQWARDLGLGGALTEAYRNTERVSGDAKIFFDHFMEFKDSLVESSDIRSSYSGDVKETFARFVDKFVGWTEQLATGRNATYDTSFYNDKFTGAQFVQFARLLQEKAALDAASLASETTAEEKTNKESLELSEEAVQAAMNKLLEKYGAIEPGENPAREIQVPRKTGENENVSKTVRTVLEAKATPEAAVPTIEQMVANGDFSYETITDKDALASANSKLQNKGWARTLSDWLGEAKKGTVSKDHTVTGWALYNNAANAKDLDTAMTVLEEMVKSQRNAAQALQATRVLKKMSPEAQLYGAQRSIENLQEELNERYGKKDAPEIKIDPALAEEFLTAKTEKARADAMANIYKDVGKQMPSTFQDKWNAWRYLAMLGNPRTHVRNIVGNAGFAPVVAAKNLTATAIEKAANVVSGGKTGRSKAVLSVKDAGLLKAAWADFENVQDQIMAGGKYSDFQMAQSAIEEGRRIFKNRLLEGARRGNSAALEAEDVWFSKPHYATALASYCKANKISPETIAEGTAIETARAYAIREAQKATYRDTNAFSQMISDLGKVDKNEKNLAKKGVGLVLQGILPFRKTPANILVRGVEYSPIGLLKSITVDSKKVAKGEMSATDLIDNISAGLTGTGLLAMGAFLAAQGLVRGHGPEDKEKEFEEMQGHQAYSLEVGGKSYTLDWLAPECLPFFVGVNLYEQSVAQREDITMSEILSAITNVSEPMLEMSCLQSLNDVFDAVGYASSNDLSALPSILASAATSYLTQAIPTILGQAERTGQDVRYSTYTTKDAFLTRDMQYAIGSATARIPGIDYNQVPYIDAWGRQESTGTVAERAAGNFLNPSYTSNIEESAMEKELLRVYGETGEASVFPTRAQRSFPVNGETKYLTADEYVKYATSKGQTSHELVEDLVNMSQYKAMSEEEKASAISDAYSLANVVAKYEVSDYTTDGWMAKAVEAKKIGIDYSKYLEVRLSVKDIESIKDADGDSIANSKGLLVMEAIYNIKGLNDKQRRRLFEDFGVGKSVINLNKAAVQAKLKGMR